MMLSFYIGDYSKNSKVLKKRQACFVGFSSLSRDVKLGYLYIVEGLNWLHELGR